MKRKKSPVSFFKQKSYLLAMVLMLAAVFGMMGVYFSEQRQAQKEERQQAELLQQQEAQEKLAQQKQKAQEKKKEPSREVDAVILPENKDFLDSPEVISSKDNIIAEAPETEEPKAEEPKTEDPEVQETGAPPQPELHFDAADLGWPLSGNVIMNYSMDQTIYFATLDQYKYNPALIIQGNVNDKVLAVTAGKVEQIAINEETGCTVTVDLGDGYQAVYGQLKEVPLEEGEWVASGDIIGYVSEPTKYYSVEGANLYFQLLKDGQSVDPMEYLQ